MGSALDIVRYCGVPRYLHSDLPLGNPCGVPYDQVMQSALLEQALALFTESESANTVVRSTAKWPGDNSWRDHYSRVDDSNREALRLKGETRRQQQAADKAAGATRTGMIP